MGWSGHEASPGRIALIPLRGIFRIARRNASESSLIDDWHRLERQWIRNADTGTAAVPAPISPDRDSLVDGFDFDRCIKAGTGAPTRRIRLTENEDIGGRFRDHCLGVANETRCARIPAIDRNMDDLLLYIVNHCPIILDLERPADSNNECLCTLTITQNYGQSTEGGDVIDLPHGVVRSWTGSVLRDLLSLQGHIAASFRRYLSGPIDGDVLAADFDGAVLLHCDACAAAFDDDLVP